MIILDLEWNRSYDNKPLEEILQIGAVRVGELGGPVLDQFQLYVKPSVHKRFDPGARSLPDLQESKDSLIDFPSAISAFRDWCGSDTVFGAWGSDLQTLEQNCVHWGLPALTVDKEYDLQAAFSRVVGTRQQVALWRAVEYCGIPAPFSFHNALFDALYTSVVAAWIPQEALEEAPAPGFSEIPFSRQPRRRIGPLPQLADVLNARLSRQATCPVCGQTVWVLQWVSRAARRTPSRQYYSTFSCPEHGRFLCRLTLAPVEGGAWRGRLSVPAITPELLAEYKSALDGAAFVCKGSRKARRKKSRGRRGS